jgi:hypothetical protein
MLQVALPTFTKMLTMRLAFLLLLFSLSLSSPALAQPQFDTSKAPPPRLDRYFIGTSLDGLIFSTALIENNNSTTWGTLRFTAVFNLGLTFNLNLSRRFGLYSGLDVKNIGFITGDTMGGTSKFRTYNVGIPIGIKIGDMLPRRSYIFLGGGVDAPVNYKEKHFVSRAQKTKSTEWFSDRTPAIMPYVFAGAAIYGFTLKIQYYPNNFFNPDFTSNNSQPYATNDVHLLLFSVGTTTPLFSRRQPVELQDTTLKNDFN